VIVDDGSRPQKAARLVLKEMDFSATLIEIDPEEKTWVNPCIPYNRGFAAAEGEIVVIQNAETLYMGDVLTVARAQEREDICSVPLLFNKSEPVSTTSSTARHSRPTLVSGGS
jgi:hypothetical protein